MEAKRSFAECKDPPEAIPSLEGSQSERKPSCYDRWRFLVSNEPFGISEIMVLRTTKADTQRNLVIAALALERYRLRHGVLPQRLDALTPAFLVAVPKDHVVRFSAPVLTEITTATRT